MSDLGIPQCPVDEVIPHLPLTSMDQEVIQNFPESIRGQVLRELTSRYQEHQSEVQVLEKRFQQEKDQLIRTYQQNNAQILKDAAKTYEEIMLFLKDAITRKGTVRMIFDGVKGTPPSVEQWLKSNPGKALVIHEIVYQCYKQGWKPNLDISPYTKSGFDDRYYGGDSLIFTCSF